MPKSIPIEVEAPDAASPKSNRLKLTEIFYSLQGESNTSGWPTIFIRLTGCPLRCQYCDTAYAFTGGEWFSQDEVIEELKQYKTPYITVTGGEPLAQKASISLMNRLCDEGYKVSLETSGAYTVANVDSRVVKVVDLKTPDSEESHRNDYNNIDLLSPEDQVKFVICSRGDYDWAVETMKKYALNEKCTVLFSPSKSEVDATQLADWILEDQLPVRYQVQLHKILWGDKEGV